MNQTIDTFDVTNNKKSGESPGYDASHRDKGWNTREEKESFSIDAVDIIFFCIGLFIVGTIAFDLVCIVGPIDVFPSRSFTNFDATSPATFTTRISSFQLFHSASTTADSPFYKIKDTFDESKPNFPSYLKWDSESSLAINNTELATFSTDNFFNVTAAVRDSTFSWICIKSLNKLAYILQVRFAGLIVRLVGEFVAVILFMRYLILRASSVMATRASAARMSASMLLFFAGLVTLIGCIIEFSASGLLGSFIGSNYCTSNPAYPSAPTASMKSTNDGEFWKQNFTFLGASLMAMVSGIIFMFSAFLIVLNGVRMC